MIFLSRMNKIQRKSQIKNDNYNPVTPKIPAFRSYCYCFNQKTSISNISCTSLLEPLFYSSQVFFFTLKTKTQQSIMNYSTIKQTSVLIIKFLIFIERPSFNKKKTNLLHVSYSQLRCATNIFSLLFWCCC